MKPTKLRTAYQVERLDDVMRFFVKSYKLEDGESLAAHEWFCDIGKGKVVFSLTVAKPNLDDLLAPELAPREAKYPREILDKLCAAGEITEEQRERLMDQ